ncbi:DUF3899 domain-containing protein [Ligilactobacillus faecis]|uniref:DUF3899 domain-containing protein n=1 Tax=Ligilactobacillus faecis TaxID=762833 RepID=UPI002468F2D3|nr:DUF3899 domain-containing protein [Ligilactobacillus faecis]WGN90568.1 DUF3899 domain-containing protein [Ligilactobacillus faecis]
MKETFKERLWLKGDLLILGLALISGIFARLSGFHVLVSDVLFMSGLVLLCIMMVDILLHAGLMAGWFQKQRKGESDEEFAKRKIDIKRVASEKKNAPIHFEKLGVNCLVLGCGLIVIAILITV